MPLAGRYSDVSYSLHIVQSWSAFVQSFVKLSWVVLELWSGHNFNTYITLGHNSINRVHGVVVLILCISSDHGLHLYQVLWKYLERFQSYGADIISILINTKEHDSVKTTHIVTVLVPCRLSNHGLHVYQVSWTYLERFQSYGANTISIFFYYKGA